jgi:hypothetical protein
VARETTVRRRALVFLPVVAEWIIRRAVQRDLEPVLGLWAAAGSPPSVTDTREDLLALLAADEEALLSDSSRAA